jgi:hypothetical protein
MSCKFATTSIVSCTVFNDEWCRLCLWKDFQFFLSNVDMVFHLTYIYALCSWLAPSVLCNSMLPILSTCSVFSLVLFFSTICDNNINSILLLFYEWILFFSEIHFLKQTNIFLWKIWCYWASYATAGSRKRADPLFIVLIFTVSRMPWAWMCYVTKFLSSLEVVRMGKEHGHLMMSPCIR